MKQTAAEIESALAQFRGEGETYTKVSIFPGAPVATDGVVYLFEACEAFWLGDIICAAQPVCRRDPSLRGMQFWQIDTDVEAKRCVVTCFRDEGDPAFKKKIGYTDFPLKQAKIWVENGVMMLPGER